jgi:hypothetical protein
MDDDCAIQITRGEANPDRIADAAHIIRPAPLQYVCAAVAAYVRSGGQAVYVERLGAEYRWSPAARSCYPLLRVLARFLDCPHTDLIMGFTSVDGWAIVADPEEERAPAYAVIEGSPADPYEIEATIERLIG